MIHIQSVQTFDFTAFKTIVMTSIAGILAAITSISYTFIIIGLMFFADLLFGILAGWRVNNEGLKMKKFALAMAVVLIYASIISLISVIGSLMRDIEAAEYAVKIVTYIFIYVTGTNTLKNLCRLFPNAKLFTALYYLLSFEFAKKFPELHKKIDENTKNKHHV